jgi:hypothetical protein
MYGDYCFSHFLVIFFVWTLIFLIKGLTRCRLRLVSNMFILSAFFLSSFLNTKTQKQGDTKKKINNYDKWWIAPHCRDAACHVSTLKTNATGFKKRVTFKLNNVCLETLPTFRGINHYSLIKKYHFVNSFDICTLNWKIFL